MVNQILFISKDPLRSNNEIIRKIENFLHRKISIRYALISTLDIIMYNY